MEIVKDHAVVAVPSTCLSTPEGCVESARLGEHNNSKERTQKHQI